MSGLSYKEQTLVRNAVSEYLEKFGMTSLRKVADYVQQKTGISPAATTISRLVREQGYDSPKPSWTWVKKVK